MRILLKKFINVIVATAIIHAAGIAQTLSTDFTRLLTLPKQYTILSTSDKIRIDGKDDEKAWRRAPWTDYFTDIVTGADSDENKRSRCKMLWDNEFLYIYAEMKEQDIWASLVQHDAPVFQDNALEIFINPDGSTFNYFELQINAYETVWDLFMPRPYRSGGTGLSSWDIRELKKAVYIAGTLNDPSDKDTAWNIELSIPFSALGINKSTIRSGMIWRMNFSRVQWQLDVKNGSYIRKTNKTSGRLLRENYTVWSPQGIINLHYPERYGYVLFADTLSTKSFISEETELLKLTLWKYYYLQQQYKKDNGKYALTIDQLNKTTPKPSGSNNTGVELRMFSNEKQFQIEGKTATSNQYLSVDHEGELRITHKK